jgi:energy-coupling factor transporter ATP-binding protein EcfA2
MTTASSLYALSLSQIATTIRTGGNKRTVLVQGHMGTGKSSLLKTLAAELPNHVPCYFDCTTKDLGDISIPSLQTMEEQGFVRFVPNEELGLHLGKPIILMIDEYGKANPAVKNAMLRLMLERNGLHPDSIVFATTNLGAEGVGDLIPPHARNRITILKSRKSDHVEAVEWGINNDMDPTMLAFYKDNPQLFESFEDVKNPNDNLGIYHPQAQRESFFTPRSGEIASDWLKQREHYDDQTLTALLIGSIGEHTALSLMAYVKLADQLPSLESIKKDPMNAKIPDSAAARCMVVYRTLASIDTTWVDAWMDYFGRLDRESQGYFANGVRQSKYNTTKQNAVMTNKKFTAWAMANNYVFTADKK